MKNIILVAFLLFPQTVCLWNIKTRKLSEEKNPKLQQKLILSFAPEGSFSLWGCNIVVVLITLAQ